MTREFTARPPAPWDFLILTASNDHQSRAYQRAIDTRRRLGVLTGIREALVIGDPGGRRVGSGGSTIYCLMKILDRCLPPSVDRCDPDSWTAALRQLRILIVHAGGDSKRLPAYAPAGKVFIPLPGKSDAALGETLFDRELQVYMNLPAMPSDAGQVVIVSGDVLLQFDPTQVTFAPQGLTGLGCAAPPELAAGHGVFCCDASGRVGRYLQKPTPAQQQDAGAVTRDGQSLLDVGVMNFDADFATTLLSLCGAQPDTNGVLQWSGPLGRAIPRAGLDFYREIACAMGDNQTVEDYKRTVCAPEGSSTSGGKLSDDLLDRIYEALCATPFHSQVLSHCGFLHFGTTRQIISSGAELLRADLGGPAPETCLCINNERRHGAEIKGSDCWIEACRINANVELAGQNVLVGVDVDQPISLPHGACLDVLEGDTRWYVRCYGVSDTFKQSASQGATFCNMPLLDWLSDAGAEAEDVWPVELPDDQRTLWEASVFPVDDTPDGYHRWLWMFQPDKASPQQKQQWHSAQRCSMAEMAELADADTFHERRNRIRAKDIQIAAGRLFRPESAFSAAELAWVLSRSDSPETFVADVLAEAHWYATTTTGTLESLTIPRILHTLGAALESIAEAQTAPAQPAMPALLSAVQPPVLAWLESIGLAGDKHIGISEWTRCAKAAAVNHVADVIMASGPAEIPTPINALRPDEIVWGRSPARLDLAGGWTDTPPYTLERGGCVINAAVDLNGQPPIHCYARVTAERVIRINSIDLGKQIEIRNLEDLLDYRSATGEFALAKAALALSAFSPDHPHWPAGMTLESMLERFGGGIELTTLAAIPKGSGLGTSSIIGAVILATIQRVMGRTLNQRELFHGVLRLEQALTTGGGWQDQIGGAVDGVKLITTSPGLVPDPNTQYVTQDVLDPHLNDGCALLYYTGITRLAKNILAHVVGRYLDRDHQAMATLGQLHALGPRTAEAMARKDLPAFGALIDAAWQLNKQLDPDSSSEEIERLLARVRQHIHGAKLLGAGGGGFLLMVCKSPIDADAVRTMLTADPPNGRARFFDFSISTQGLVATVC